ncbi:MAG TPA: phosphoenolpyruvate synthase [Oligoflexus sp.]|uniref:phosphoenolpyruvate synthase n=1 Tax=Oligoflexus sp. TaxID=1971216 RepID=UPI002D808965|nr:phosphoenolpyruvate synthase [Oligoflexus sp.]HET9238631.1 phosphoenolpyruvate synthase [Oligoflexus sp.]
MKTSTAAPYIQWLGDISLNDLPQVGGKTAALGEMYQKLGAKGIAIPNGFGITAAAYWFFLDENGLRDFIRSTIEGTDLKNADELQRVGQTIRQRIVNARLPEALQKPALEAFRELMEGRWDAGVAIRSSATAEDLPEASFAGQQETYLNVRSEEQFLLSCKQCFASLFTDRAISYREDRGFDHFSIALSICVQHMVRSDLACSGIMFSLDTETGFKNAVLINASYGLGENIVQGAVNPDEIYVFKPTLRQGKRPILQKKVGSKEYKMIYDAGGSRMVRNVPVPEAERGRICISDEDILQLAHWAGAIEDYFSELKGRPTPMDMEWGKDGISGRLYILQARPETVQSQKNTLQLSFYRLKEPGKVLAEGRAVGEKIAHGKARVIRDAMNLRELQDGEILVTEKTDPDWEPSMRKAAAIVTNRGGRTCHAAIVSRELGLPAIVGTENGTEALRDGQMITVSCAEGETGHVYEGALAYEQQSVDAEAVAQRPRTQIMMNIANPDEAFRLSQIPNDGVGLARIEFIINHSIKIHPMALLRFDQLKNHADAEKIAALTQGYPSRAAYFIDKLAQGVAMLGAAFYPKPVIVRFSDFKTNEYANLLGGRQFEPVEDNPMIGFRGASRYYSPLYKEGFALECEAIKKVRNEMGLTNVKVMIPFCRTLDEGRKVLQVMKENGLERGRDGLEVYVMCEIPSNVILADEFAKIFDGFSIGSNDLTQLTLGVDRDSELLAEIFDERNAAVQRTISELLRKAQASHTKIGICGQAPSDYPEFAAYLVKEGIDSISLNPDTLMKTTLLVKEIEAAEARPHS